MRKEAETQSRLGRYVRAPLRALRGARDLYVRSLTGCAGRYEGAMAGGYPGSVPRSYSLHPPRTSGSDGDLRELIRAASQGRLGLRAAAMVTKSQSVAVGRIDEDSPCEFSGDLRPGSDLLFPRSRSVAAGGGRIKRRSRVFG